MQIALDGRSVDSRTGSPVGWYGLCQYVDGAPGALARLYGSQSTRSFVLAPVIIVEGASGALDQIITSHATRICSFRHKSSRRRPHRQKPWMAPTLDSGWGCRAGGAVPAWRANCLKCPALRRQENWSCDGVTIQSGADLTALSSGFYTTWGSA